MDNQTAQQPQPTPTPTQPGAPQKKSNTGLVVAIIVIVLFCLPILAIAIFFFALSGYFSSNPGAAKEILDSISEGVNEAERQSNENYVAGTWNCASGTGSTTDRDNYSTTLKLNKDMTFKYGPYGDLTNNHYSGTYTFKDEDKHTPDGKYDYYMIDFDTTEAVFDGEEDTDSGKGINQMEMGITKTEDGKQAITIFTSSYNMYYCYNDEK